MILGITGFIGFHLAKKSLKLGWNVYGVSKSRPKKYRYLAEIKYFFLDLSKKKFFSQLDDFSFDYVVNLSGYAEHNDNSKMQSLWYLWKIKITVD